MLQVRNLPDDVHAKLKQRAAAARMSLSDYVATELAKLVTYRTNAEIFADASRRARAAGRTPSAGAAAREVNAARRERDAQLAELFELEPDEVEPGELGPDAERDDD